MVTETTHSIIHHAHCISAAALALLCTTSTANYCRRDTAVHIQCGIGHYERFGGQFAHDVGTGQSTCNTERSHRQYDDIVVQCWFDRWIAYRLCIRFDAWTTTTESMSKVSVHPEISVFVQHNDNINDSRNNFATVMIECTRTYKSK